jgi:hypothetical protein
MRSILALAAALAVLVGGGVAVASPTGTSKSPAVKPAAKAPKSMIRSHHCHMVGDAPGTTSFGL